MCDSDWQVQVEYRPGMMSTFIYVSRRIPDGIEFQTKGGLEMALAKQGELVKDDVYFARFEDDYIGRLLVGALDKRGIKAPSQSYIEGELKAQTAHLNDIRKLIPKLTTPPKEVSL